MRTQGLWQKLLVKGVTLAMERECKSFANWVYLDSLHLYLSYLKNSWKWKNFKFQHASSLFFFFFFFSSRKFELSEGISLRWAPKCWENECSSYPRSELTGDFYKEVSRNGQGIAENSSR